MEAALLRKKDKMTKDALPLETDENQRLVDSAPTRIIESVRALERRVDVLVLRSGINDTLLRQQLADRHAKMIMRTRQRNSIRVAKFQGKVDADVAHVFEDVMGKREEVTLPAILHACINEIVLKAEMGVATVRLELEGHGLHQGCVFASS